MVMATLDNINLFANGGPAQNTFEDEYRKLVAVFDSPGVMGSPPSFEEYVAMRQKSQAADTARQTMFDELGEGNVRKAYEEGFTQLPIMEQLGTYVFPPTGVPIESYETGYFADEADFSMKSPQEFALDVLNPSKNIFQKLPVKAEDPMSAVLAPLSALGAIGGIGELANIPKAGLMALRRYQQKTMDGGGGGGIGGLPQPQQETTKDLAGYKSNTLEEAKAVSSELSPKALLQYVKSNKRTNPSNNKTGTALKQTEIDEIDFEAFEAQYPNKDYTNEDILQYIDDNRIQLYRVSRSEENPTYTSGGGSDSIELELDEPLTQQMQDERANQYLEEYDDFVDKQKELMQNNFPDGINKQNYDAFVERQREFIQRTDIDTSGQAPSQLTEAYLSNNDPRINPFMELGEPQYDVFKADGSKIDIDFTTGYENFLDALDKGYTLKPRILDQNVADDIAETAATLRTDGDYEAEIGDKAYRYVSDDNIYEVIGNESDGYFIRHNGGFDSDADFGENLSLDEARLQIQQREVDEGFIGSGIGTYDDYTSNDALIDVLPSEVIDGSATIPTKYDDYDSFRLPMGGATDYQEHTIHVKNPKTSRRYTSGDGTKHFGGGDELFHLRTTIRTDENGKEVLFVEEVQSDLHSTARSTQTDANYEVPEKEKPKIRKKVKEIDSDFEITYNSTELEKITLGDITDPYYVDTGIENRGYNANTINNMAEVSRGNKPIEYIGRDYQTALKNIEKKYGKEKFIALADAVKPYANKGKLPDFPYKKDWVDIAVKEALKIGAEKGVDRVAFTNAATQINRNYKNLNYVQDTVITKVPSREEILASDEFAEDLARDKKMYYDDYVNNTHNTNLPIPTIEEYFARPSMGGESATNLDTVKEITYKKLARDYGTEQYKYKLENVGYKLEGDEILNPQRMQMEGDDYDNQRFGQRMLTNEEELLEEVPEQFREQVKKDLAAGKSNISLNIDDLEGSGKKFLEIYKNEIPRGIVKALKDLKVKDVKPSISDVLYSADDVDPNRIVEMFKKQEVANEDGGYVLEAFIQPHSSIGIDLTDEMREKILREGLPSMYMGGKVSKSNSMDRPIGGNRREM